MIDINLIEKIVTIFGFPIGIYAIWSSNKSSQRSIDVQIVATLSLRFQEKWESEWRGLANSSEPIAKSTKTEDRATLYDALNWIDWLGVLIDRKAFSDPVLMLKSIDPSLRRITFLGHEILNEDGKDHWPGVYCVAKWLNILHQGTRDGEFLRY